MARARQLVAEGDLAEAVRILWPEVRRAPEDLALRGELAGVLRYHWPDIDPAGLSAFVERCLTQPGVAISPLLGVTVRLLEGCASFEAAWRGDPTDAHLSALATHPLLSPLIRRTLATHPGLFRVVVNVRRALLRGGRDPVLLPLWAAVATQAFITDYLLWESPDESRAIAALTAEVVRAPERASPWSVAALCAYRPGAGEPWGEALAERADEGLGDMLDVVLRRPLEERRLGRHLPTLTRIREGTSAAVAARYEAHPYPRWVALPRAAPEPFADAFQRRVGDRLALTITHLRPDGLRFAASGRDVLVAGGGTGAQPIALALAHAELNVLSIDLSRASLAFAQRQARALGATNVTFAQADLLELDALGRTFDQIHCTGVLQHLSEPLTGLRVLARQLRPGGLMRLALYSRLGRRGLAPLRRPAADPTLAELQAWHRAMIDGPPTAARAELLGWRDAYNASELRDLLFHVQECDFELPEIAALLSSAGLEFLAFELADPRAERAFRARYPAPDAWRSLDAWHRFERDAPDTFRAMYHFWVVKS